MSLRFARARCLTLRAMLAYAADAADASAALTEMRRLMAPAKQRRRHHA